MPILIQVYFNAGLAYWLNRKLGVEWCVAGPSALIGASNFFELAVATAIALFGFQSGRGARNGGRRAGRGAGDAVGRPDRAASRGWYERGMTPGEAAWRRRSVVVSALGITQTLAWGSTYYLPAVLADPICGATFIFPATWFFGIFSAALLLSGLLGPARRPDRSTGMAGGTCWPRPIWCLPPGLVLLSFASGHRKPGGLAWAVIGIGMGFGLYEAAFATVAGLYGRDARNAITGITLFAGFASTVGWPPSALFIDAFGWRGACLAWAALHLLIGLPLNRLLVPKAPPASAD